MHWIMFTYNELTMAALSSSVSWKSNTWVFSIIRFSLTDFGIVIKPWSKHQRIITWATVFLCLKQKMLHITTKSVAKLHNKQWIWSLQNFQQSKLSNYIELIIYFQQTFWPSPKEVDH